MVVTDTALKSGYALGVVDLATQQVKTVTRGAPACLDCSERTACADWASIMKQHEYALLFGSHGLDRTRLRALPRLVDACLQTL